MFAGSVRISYRSTPLDYIRIRIRTSTVFRILCTPIYFERSQGDGRVVVWDLREPEALHRRAGAGAGERSRSRGRGQEEMAESEEASSAPALRRPSCARGNWGEALTSHRAPLVALRSLDQLQPECVPRRAARPPAALHSLNAEFETVRSSLPNGTETSRHCAVQESN